MGVSLYFKQDKAFAEDHVLFWSNLSRLNVLFVLLNITIFFLTGLITQGYYYTYYSLSALGVVGLGMVMPTILVKKLWYYLCFLFFEAIGIYFCVSSIVYWVRHGALQGS